MKNDINNVRIILVETTHPGNIGATARAMKTMCQEHLCLVNPKIFPSAEATARAAGADDVLAKAGIFDDIKSAIADCDLVITTSARPRNLQWPTLNPSQCAELIKRQTSGNIAIIFGRESSGLSNKEMELGNYVIRIPANERYSSLNIAAAVQLICYEILKIGKDDAENVNQDNNNYVNQEKMEMFYRQLEDCMIAAGYHNPENPRRLMPRMRRLFNRAGLDKSEWQIFRGFLSMVYNKTK